MPSIPASTNNNDAAAESSAPQPWTKDTQSAPLRDEGVSQTQARSPTRQWTLKDPTPRQFYTRPLPSPKPSSREEKRRIAISISSASDESSQGLTPTNARAGVGVGDSRAFARYAGQKNPWNSPLRNDIYSVLRRPPMKYEVQVSPVGVEGQSIQQISNQPFTNAIPQSTQFGSAQARDHILAQRSIWATSVTPSQKECCPVEGTCDCSWQRLLNIRL